MLTPFRYAISCCYATPFRLRCLRLRCYAAACLRYARRRCPRFSLICRFRAVRARGARECLPCAALFAIDMSMRAYAQPRSARASYACRVLHNVDSAMRILICHMIRCFRYCAARDGACYVMLPDYMQHTFYERAMMGARLCHYLRHALAALRADAATLLPITPAPP